MKNILLGSVALFLTSSVVMAGAIQTQNLSLRSLVEIKFNKKNNPKFSPLMRIMQDEDDNHNLPPIRSGKVKYSISKGIYSNTSGGWDYQWKEVCEIESQFYVHVANSSWDYEEPSLINCKTSLDGKEVSISTVLYAVEGSNVILDEGERPRQLSAYALFSYIDSPFMDSSKLPELPVQLFASEKRMTSQFIMMSRPPLIYSCQGSSSEQVSKDDADCVAKWNEVFRVTAVVED